MLQGIWMGAYQVHHADSDKLITSFPYLYDFNKKKVVIKSFYDGEYESIDNYKLLENKLIINKDTLIIKCISNDSLVLYLNFDYLRQFVLKRLVGSYKYDIDLTHRAFKISSKNILDSLDFINDSVALHIGTQTDFKFRPSKWKIFKYKSYNFLLIDQYLRAPALIENDSAGIIELLFYFTKVEKVKLIPLISQRDTTGLIGNWLQEVPTMNLVPPPFCIEEKDYRMKLKISLDSIEISQCGETNRLKWELNSTNEYIYFPDNFYKLSNKWKILNLSTTELEVERNRTYIKSSYTEKITFKKQNITAGNT